MYDLMLTPLSLDAGSITKRPCAVWEKLPNDISLLKPGLLVLRDASISLTESDFRRLVPRGKYIKEWKGAGNIERGVCVPIDAKTLAGHLHLTQLPQSSPAEIAT